MITRYRKLFRSSPELGLLALCGFLQLTLLLLALLFEQVKWLLHALSAK